MANKVKRIRIGGKTYQVVEVVEKNDIPVTGRRRRGKHEDQRTRRQKANDWFESRTPFEKWLLGITATAVAGAAATAAVGFCGGMIAGAIGGDKSTPKLEAGDTTVLDPDVTIV